VRCRYDIHDPTTAHIDRRHLVLLIPPLREPGPGITTGSGGFDIEDTNEL
jgi:hypothetical protein